ncbi:MAG: transcriptional repressor [Pseudonocardiaceae bacterium]|nr:transcriptional repressor [Pseudonocardiaceae bacterium]
MAIQHEDHRYAPDRRPPQQQLRDAGLRVTAPRVAVLHWLAEHPHSTADQVGNGVRQRIGSVSTQAVYDVLAACTETGLVRRIEPAGHPARFERRIGDNHHHLVCRSCGRTEDVDCVVDARPCLTPNNGFGFAVDEAEVVFWGLCPACQRRARSVEASTQTARVPPVHNDSIGHHHNEEARP